MPRRLVVLALAALAACEPMRGQQRKPEPSGSGPKVDGYIRAHGGGSVDSGALPRDPTPGALPRDVTPGAPQRDLAARARRRDLAAGAAPRDLTPDFTAPPGLAVTLFAESPDVFNPAAIDVDARGRVWAAEAVNYRQWRGRNPGEHREGGDRIVILEDTDGDGGCDASKVFVQDPELVSPLGIAVLQDSGASRRTRVVVSCSPSIFVFTDEDGDDRPDAKEVFLTGFGGRDHDHGVHSVVVGPDGKWYVAVGNAGPHMVTDEAGWTLRSGSIYRGGGEFETDNAPGLVSDDGRVWTGGLILRCDEDGSGLRVVAHNFRNEYEVALDSYGNLFTADNDDDGNACCRTTWVMEGGNYGYFSADGSREWSADRRPGQDVWAAHWHQDDPGVLPAGSRNGAGGPTGVCVYEGDLLGPEWKGRVLNADAGANVVYAHAPATVGAGIELVPGKLIASRPEAGEKAHRWFRPSDVCVAPDGSVLVADWWDPGVGGHLAGDSAAYGRILRVAPAGARYAPPGIDVSNVAGAVAALRNPAVHVRALGASALRGFGEDAVGELARLASDAREPRFAARAVWVAASGDDAAWRVVESAIAAGGDDLRVTALRARGLATSRWVTAGAEALMEDLRTTPKSPAVARQTALACVGIREAGLRFVFPVRQVLLELAARVDADDRYALEALAIAAASHRITLYRALGLAEIDPLSWSPAQAAFAWRLHPAEAVSALFARARAMSLASRDRAQAVCALGFVRERPAAEAMLDLALVGPDDVRPLATWWVEHNALDLWREYRLEEQLGPRGLADSPDAELRWSSGLLSAGSMEVDVDVSGAKTLWLVVGEGRNGQSCDWADWLEPVLVGVNGSSPLTKLPWTSAKSAWGSVNVGKNTTGGELRLGGRVYADGIGTHARSEIAYALPDGTTRFRALAALDDGGTAQGGPSDVEFEVWVERKRDPEKWRRLARELVESGQNPNRAMAIIDELASDPDGRLALLSVAGEGELSPEVASAEAKALYSSPELAIRALATQRWIPSPEPSEPLLPPWEILKLPGDASRGARAFFGEAARCSSCHAFDGRGADIGPDLTAIAAKYAKPQILDAIMAPSAAIAHGYDTWMIETNDGLLHPGFVLSEGEKIVIKDMSGRREVIEASEIVSRTKQTVSAMPSGVAMNLSPQDLADILEFVSHDPRAPGKRLAPRKLFNGVDLTGWTYFLDAPNVRVEDVWTVDAGVLQCRGTPTGYLRTEEDFTNFVLTLEWRFDPSLPPGNSGVLMRMVGDDKIWPKSIEAQLHHRNAGDIWNIDEVPMQADPARTHGRRTEKRLPCNERPLGEWNRYVITLDGGELTLEVNGEVQNTAHWCEEVPGKICLQSEGAAIQFRNIEITPIER